MFSYFISIAPYFTSILIFLFAWIAFLQNAYEVTKKIWQICGNV